MVILHTNNRQLHTFNHPPEEIFNVSMDAATALFPASISTSRILGRQHSDGDLSDSSNGDGDDDDNFSDSSNDNSEPWHQVSTSSTRDTTSAPTSTLDKYPPLTTLFTPDPSCLSFYIESYVSILPANDGYDHSYHAIAFPDAGCWDESGLPTVRRSLSCYPETIDGNYVLTYSPGYFCPVGMATVDSLSVPNGAWCCPNGLTWEGGLCRKTTSQATLLSTEPGNCAGEEIVTIGRLINRHTIALSATPILLTGQKFRMTTPFTSATSSSAVSATSSIQTSDHKDVPTNQRSPSRMAKVGIILGSILGTAFLLLLAAFYIRRRSKAQEVEKAQAEQTVKAEPDEYMGKPELEGSKAYVYTVKAELDAAAIRAELEGDLTGPHGDGIHVMKPELEGTVGTERNRGAFVRNKSELEAISKPCASTTQHNFAEIEAPSAGDGVARSDIRLR
ncbi:hypothetical protein F5B21DRAFT_335157 [Xylaria acuta]|nr:hypothetical protein F5B21DRAFT_335157 [Xylaria acuta]